jgi:hypothetical protein
VSIRVWQRSVPSSCYSFKKFLDDPLSFEYVITLWQAHLTWGNQVERTSKVVKEFCLFICGGGVEVGILSLALRTSTACEIYGYHGSDCEEHVFWHIFLPHPMRNYSSSTSTFDLKYGIIWLYICIFFSHCWWNCLIHWVGVSDWRLPDREKKFELRQKHAPFLQYKHLDRSFTILPFC